MVTTADIITSSSPDARARMSRLLAEADLLTFMRQAWTVLEPESREFRTGWALEAICDHLMAVTRGEVKRLLINVPPGCTKSLTTCVMFPAWEWGPRNLPHMRYVKASYAEHLSARDNRRMRQLVSSAWYQRMWGERFKIADDLDAKMLFGTDHNGFAYATSVGGVGTGERGDRFIVDDPHNVRTSESDVVRESAIHWFTEVVPTRLNDPDESAIIVIMQRVHDGDVSGEILRRELNYTHLMLPMEYEPERRCVTCLGFEDPRTEDGELLWPERFSAGAVADLKSVMGAFATAGQFQQNPVPRGGGLFKRDWFGSWHDAGDHYELRQNGKVSRVLKADCWRIAAADTAQSEKVSADYTVRQVWDVTPDGRMLLIDQWREQVQAPQVDAEMRRTLHQWRPAVLGIEAKNAGQGTVQRLQSEGLPVLGLKASIDKVSRATTASVFAENGRVFLPERAEWLETFMTEVSRFPMAAHDDQTDTFAHAAQMVANRDQWRPVIREYSDHAHVERLDHIPSDWPAWVYLRVVGPTAVALLLTVSDRERLHVVAEVYSDGGAAGMASAMASVLEQHGRDWQTLRGVMTDPDEAYIKRSNNETPAAELHQLGVPVGAWPKVAAAGVEARISDTRAAFSHGRLALSPDCSRLSGELKLWRHKEIGKGFEGPDLGVRCLMAWVASEPKQVQPELAIYDSATF